MAVAVAESTVDDFARAAAGVPDAARGVIRGFSASELAIIDEARGILGSSELATLRAAHAVGESATVHIGGRVIQYEPGFPYSGMTNFGEGGFVLGRHAFSSSSELGETLLHELHRLLTSASSSGVSASLAARETAAAASFAKRAVGALGL
jgi:hypothetical protein